MILTEHSTYQLADVAEQAEVQRRRSEGEEVVELEVELEVEVEVEIESGSGKRRLDYEWGFDCLAGLRQ